MSSASPVGRAFTAHWPLWAVCALFLLAGALAFDDYGASADVRPLRRIGNAALDYLAGDGERAFEQTISPHDRYFGAAFEAPLALIERIPGLESSRNVYLGRRVLTHLFFLAGGAFCYLLVLRMFGSRPLALLATVLFLLHPRIYAHSFFNSKDVPFLTMFMIALYLAHRAFRRDTLGAFLLCGAGVGVLVNLRIMGVILFAAVLILRALDLSFAASADERRRVLWSGGAFALAAILALYALSPILWTDPIGRFAELVRALRFHQLEVFSLFQGELLYSLDGPPFDYIPVWIGITTPPATLLLALFGAATLAWRGLRRPRDVLRNGPLRFGFLLLALPVATMLAVVLLRNNIYDDWRHLFFLYAPLLLLAILGLPSPRGRWMRAGAYALAGAAIAVTVVSMVRIHPYQNSYFNLAADRTTPERPGSRYGLDYWEQSVLGALAAIVEEHPSGPLFADVSLDSARLLPPGERERFTVTRDFRSGEPNFLEFPDPGVCPLAPASPSAVVHAAHVYASTLHCVVDPVAWFGDVRRAALAREPLVRSVYDVWRDGRLLTYVRDGCPPEDVAGGSGPRLFLHVVPRDPDDLPRWRRKRWLGSDNLDLALRGGAARIDGNCVAVVVLPDYPIAGIRTGQLTDDGIVWEVRFTPDGQVAVPRAADEPFARSRYDLWLDGRMLSYVRDGCTDEDAAPWFFLHVFPVDEGDLPGDHREHGFDNLDFTLKTRGARFGERCAAVVTLPDYPIATVRTGQYDETGTLWAVDFTLPVWE